MINFRVIRYDHDIEIKVTKHDPKLTYTPPCLNLLYLLYIMTFWNILHICYNIIDCNTLNKYEATLQLQEQTFQNPTTIEKNDGSNKK